MVVTAKKWGNGMGIYFPNSLMNENTEFDITIDSNGNIHLKRKMTIDEMIESIDPVEMRNDPDYKLWNATPLVGREQW